MEEGMRGTSVKRQETKYICQHAKLYKPEREKFTEEYSFLRELDCGSKVVNAVYVGNHPPVDSMVLLFFYLSIFLFSLAYFSYHCSTSFLLILYSSEYI